MFSGCKTCAKELRGCAKNPDYNCPHFTDEERGDSITITTLELEMALEVNKIIIINNGNLKGGLSCNQSLSSI